MVSDKIKALRSKVQGATETVREKKQAARERRERAKFRKQLKISQIRESAPVREAKDTRREFNRLSDDVSELAGEVTGDAGGAVRSRAGSVVESAQAASERVGKTAKNVDEALGEPGKGGGSMGGDGLDVAADQDLETVPHAGEEGDGLFGPGEADLTSEMGDIDDDLLE